MTEKERMLDGKLYLANDKELNKLRDQARDLLDQFNKTSFKDDNQRTILIKKLVGSMGKDVVVNKPFYCDYGKNIHIGDHFYANYDCIILDVNRVTIGNHVFFGPRVSIYTAGHPIDKDVRNTELEYGKEVIIGNDVWIGGNVVINPGVTIGDNVIIGSGSVVTKNIESGVIAAGNPCKVIRKMIEKDQIYWENEKLKYETSGIK